MKKKITKLLSVVLSFAILFSIIPLNVFAADDESYVAFGDSIPAGVSLNAGEKNFVTLLGEKTGVEATNYGISGQTAAELKTKMVTNNQYDADIIDADYITITIGGNDLMAVFYGLVAAHYNATPAGQTAPIDLLQVAGILAGPDGDMKTAVMNSAMGVMMSGYSGATEIAFKDKSTAVKNDIQNMITYIRGKNPNVKIYVTNQYNPYKGIMLVGTFFESGLTDFNGTLDSLTDCTVIDVHGPFDGANVPSGTVTNAKDTTNLDFHPNEAGHVLYKTTLDNSIPLDPLTGTAKITGTPQFGQPALTASLDGGNSSNLSYQWKRDNIDIAGATGSSYTLTQDDIGTNITVAITANGDSNKSGTITSSAVVVGKADRAKPVPPSLELPVTHNSIKVIAEAGQEYRINGGTWQSSGIFGGLTSETEYKITTRTKETQTHKISDESEPLTITTAKAPTVKYTQNMTKGSNKDVVFIIEGRDLPELNGLRYNGEEVDPANYTKEQGSIIITLRGAYVSTLPVGTHTFTAMLETETIDLNLQVAATNENLTTNETEKTEMPNTGDNANMIFYIILGFVALGGIGFILCRKKLVSK